MSVYVISAYMVKSMPCPMPTMRRSSSSWDISTSGYPLSYPDHT